MVFGAIHSFEGYSTAFWQRHGIATCSAHLSGFAAAATHFLSGLPKSPESSRLAAARVPSEHLSLGVGRSSWPWDVSTSLVVDSKALVRLYR